MGINTKMSVAPNKGPFAYENWLSHISGVPTVTTYEFPLYTDAHITGEITDELGPYQLINGLEFREDDSIRPAIVLRSEFPE